MLRTSRRLQPATFFSPIVASLLGLSTLAFADPILTPSGPVDRSCFHEVPNGATIDFEKGDVSLAGSLVAHYDACPVSWSARSMPAPVSASVVPSRSGGAAGAGAGGWYAFEGGAATTIHGLTQFNALGVQWVVPPAPEDSASDTSIVYLFPGLENSASGQPPYVSILQPVLQWGKNQANGGHYWQIVSMASVTGVTFYEGGAQRVNPGDVIQGLVQQYQSSPDAWEVVTYDVTLNVTSTYYANPIPASWPKYNYAATGALEAYGSAAENSGLSMCTELPATVGVAFTPAGISEAGPAWNTVNNACSLVNWTTSANPLGLSPNCFYWVGQNSACGGPLIGWTI